MKDIVFIDTNIFEKNNFLDGNRINSLLELSKAEIIKIIMPMLIKDEIKSRFKKNIKKTTESHQTFVNKSHVLKNIKSHDKYFDTIDIDDIITEFNAIFDNRLLDAKVTFINYPSNLDLSEIFSLYFKQEKPFGSASKKNEFPDVFAIKIIEQWCDRKKINKIIVLTDDKDWIEYPSTLFQINNEIEYVDFKLKEYDKTKEKLKFLEAIFMEKHAFLQEEIRCFIHGKLEKFDFYSKKLNYVEIEEVSIKELYVDLDIEYYINTVNDTIINFECNVDIAFDIDITHIDEDSGFYDTDDRLCYDQVYIKSNFNDSEIISFDFEFRIPVEGLKYADIKVIDIESILLWFP